MKNSIALILMWTLLVSCNYVAQEKKIVEGENIFEKNGNEISYFMVEQAVFKLACTSCHSINGSRGSNKGGVNLESYQAVFDQRGAIKTEILNSTMPKDSIPLTAYQKAIILAWLDFGAPELATNSKSSDDDGSNAQMPNAPTAEQPAEFEAPEISAKDIFYDSVAKYVFKPNCIKCHSGEPGSEKVDLSNYASVYKYRFEIAEQLDMGFMPPKAPKGKPLTDKQNKIINAWLTREAPEGPAEPIPLK